MMYNINKIRIRQLLTTCFNSFTNMLIITIHLISFIYFETQEGDDGNMVYVNEKGKVDISREGKFMSVMPPGKSLNHVSLPFKNKKKIIKDVILQ